MKSTRHPSASERSLTAVVSSVREHAVGEQRNRERYERDRDKEQEQGGAAQAEGVAPSRTAAIGGTFVALTAGASPATSVTTIPISNEMMTVRGATISPVVGRSLFTALKNAFSPTARPIPANSPMIAPSSPITNASMLTEVRSWRLEAPIVRSVANSRIRCETVIGAC